MLKNVLVFHSCLNLHNQSLSNTDLSLVPVAIEGEMQKSYLDYAMSVIVSRALPDCRDGLKPVHRRILYAMHEAGNYHDKPYKKSARVVGDVMGKYHPHGDAAIYSSLVRMAQDFSLRVPLIDGQGNFGSMDGDSPAQMRYTEVRLAGISHEMLSDITKNTVDFRENYDGSEQEPTVLPSKFPNLLVNGTSGIAVGMATNIPTHNIGEVIDACCAYIDDSEITIDSLIEIVPGPDFPTGGTIVGTARARKALATGRGSIIMRAKTEFEQIGGKDCIIVNEIPYQVNKSELLKKIEYLIKEKTIEGISDLRDETNKLGVRIVIELKKGFIQEVILNQLFKFTQLQTSFGVNMLALNGGKPMMMNLRSVIEAFVKFRKEVVTRRTTFLLGKARERAHTLIGLSLAVANIDEVIAIIRAAPNPNVAKERLMERSWTATSVIPLLNLVDDYRNKISDGKCFFTEEQAKAILEMRLQRLTALEKDKIENELNQLAEEITKYLKILSSSTVLMQLVRDELVEVKEKYATPRITEIVPEEGEIDIEDLIQKEDMVVTFTMSGYIKRVPLDSYRAQKRGGTGRSAMSVHDDDVITDVIATDTHTPLLFFSNQGKVYKTKVYKLPLASPQSKGRALVNILQLAEGEKIASVMEMSQEKIDDGDKYIVFSTAKGKIRRNDVSDFLNIQSNGKIAIRMDDDDSLVGVQMCNDQDHVLLSTRLGKSIRFPINNVRVFKSRTSDGVRAIKLSKEGDSVISLSILKGGELDLAKRDEYLKLPVNLRMKIAEDDEKAQKKMEKMQLDLFTPSHIVELAKREQFILSITEKGYGKRTSAYEYRVTARGGQGVMNIDTSKRNGKVVASFHVSDNDEIMLMTNAGTLIRTEVKDIRITGRNAMGVKIIKTRNDELVTSVSKISG